MLKWSEKLHISLTTAAGELEGADPRVVIKQVTALSARIDPLE